MACQALKRALRLSTSSARSATAPPLPQVRPGDLEELRRRPDAAPGRLRDVRLHLAGAQVRRVEGGAPRVPAAVHEEIELVPVPVAEARSPVAVSQDDLVD